MGAEQLMHLRQHSRIFPRAGILQKPGQGFLEIIADVHRAAALGGHGVDRLALAAEQPLRADARQAELRQLVGMGRPVRAVIVTPQHSQRPGPGGVVVDVALEPWADIAVHPFPVGQQTGLPRGAFRCGQKLPVAVQGLPQGEGRKHCDATPCALAVVVDAAVIASQAFAPLKQLPDGIQIPCLPRAVRQAKQRIDQFSAATMYDLTCGTKQCSIKPRMKFLHPVFQQSITPLLQQRQRFHFSLASFLRPCICRTAPQPSP